MTLISQLLLLLVGAVAGIAAGFLGIGGGAILTPLCLLVFPTLNIGEENMIKIIFGTNMFLVTVFSLSAVIQHHGNRKVDWRTLLVMGPLAVVGSFAGAWAASITDSSDLKKAFAVLLIISSLFIIVKGTTKPVGSSESRDSFLSRKFLPLLGLVTGFAGSFLGIGGGVVMIPVLILIFAFPVDKVAATSSSIIIFIGLAGMSSYIWHGWDIENLPGWSTGYVWWSAAIPLALGGVPMARIGAKLNAKTQDKLLQRIFGACLLMIALKILFF